MWYKYVIATPQHSAQVDIRHPRYHEYTQGITLLFDETKDVQLQLALLPGTVEVTVNKVVLRPNHPIPLGTPASGVKVTLGTLTGTEISKGRYRITAVKPGKYQVTASLLPVFKATSKEVVVKGGGDVVTVNILLMGYMIPPGPTVQPR